MGRALGSPIDCRWENRVADADLLQGTLDLLVLHALGGEPLHGHAIARHIQRTSGDVLAVKEGSLYPALHRLERRGLVRAAWGLSENNRRARFYELTPRARRTIVDERTAWTRFADAVARVIAARPAGAR
jgi:transcriptional regulator